MAYMTQDHKARIAELLKTIIPLHWKYSLAIKYHSTIVLTITAAPVDIIEHIKTVYEKTRSQERILLKIEKWVDVNPHYLENQFEGELLTLFKQIFQALNLDNYNRSNPIVVGHYIRIHIGKWDKPFEHIC
jgi:hypothetical protein